MVGRRGGGVKRGGGARGTLGRPLVASRGLPGTGAGLPLEWPLARASTRMPDILDSEFATRPHAPARSRLGAASRWLVLGVAVSALAGGWWYRPGDATTAPSATLGAVDARIDATPAGQAAVDQAEPTRIAPTPVNTAYRSAPRVQFERTDDLYAFVQTLAPAVRARDADAMWLVSKVYDYCSGYAVAPAAYARDTGAIRDIGQRGWQEMVAARERVSSRCARFVPEDDLSSPMVVMRRVEAAKAGSLPAEAALAAGGQPLKKTDDYLRDLVARVRESKDPDAYSALSPGMGIAASGRQAFPQDVSGTQFAELAWQLAACRLGLDCGPQSALMTSYCANGGICSRDPAQDFQGFVFDAAVPRQGADVVNEMVDSLVGEQKVTQ